MPFTIKLLPAILSLTLIGSCLHAPYNEQSDSAKHTGSKDIFYSLEKTLSKAVLEKNTRLMKTIIADDLVGVLSSGATISKTDMVGEIEDGSNNITLDELKNFQVWHADSMAVVTGILHMAGKRGESNWSSNNHYTGVWKRRKGQWQLSFFQETKNTR